MRVLLMNVSATPVESNPYSPPQARVADMDQPADALLYVVAPRKFLILMIGTVAAYSIYWFYKNWSMLNRDKGYWPVARAIFAIFYTHALFNEVNGVLEREGKLRTFAWSPSMLATVFVVSTLASSVCGQLASRRIGLPVTVLLSALLIVPRVFTLYRAQLAINLAAADPEGLRNRSVTLANVAWLALGALFWASVIFGWYVILSGRMSSLLR
jgi:hypothetical protein